MKINEIESDWIVIMQSLSSFEMHEIGQFSENDLAADHNSHIPR